MDGLKAELKMANAEFKRVIAKLDGQIRRNPQRYRIDKITETVVANALVLQKKYKNAEASIWEIENKIDEVSHYHNLLDAAAKALDHKKMAIEGLIKLHGQSYFAGPKVEENNTNTIANMKMQRSLKRK